MLVLVLLEAWDCGKTVPVSPSLALKTLEWEHLPLPTPPPTFLKLESLGYEVVWGAVYSELLLDFGCVTILGIEATPCIHGFCIVDSTNF
jgi:hypothetical protein